MHFLLCFFGLLRSLNHTISSIEDNVFNPIVANGHTFDLLVHSYHFSGTYANSRSGETPIRLDFSGDLKRLQQSADIARYGHGNGVGDETTIMTKKMAKHNENDWIMNEDQDKVDKQILQPILGPCLKHGNGWAETDSTNATLLNHLRALNSMQRLHDHLHHLLKLR